MLQQDVLELEHGSVLHTIDIGAGLHYGAFIIDMDAEKAWRTLLVFWIIVYAEYIDAYPGTNFNLECFEEIEEGMGTIV